MAGHDMIVVGASTGGVQALTQLVRGLPAGLPATVCVVCHFPEGRISMLPDILSRNGALLATHATHGEPVYPGQIYVAPPDHHLTLDNSHLEVQRGARENHLRPAIDPLFRSAARVYGSRAIGVLLSGASNDGVAGLMAIRHAGGVAVVQDPRDATMSVLPEQAMKLAGADHVVPVAQMPELLAALVRQAVPRRASSVDPIEHMNDVVERNMAEQERGERRGNVSTFTCPECGGALWQVDEPQPVRFRCHVGHAYYAEALLAKQSEALEAALWTAVRTFKEKMVLSRQLAHRARSENNAGRAERFDDQARQAGRYASLIQEMMVQGTDPEPLRSVGPDPRESTPRLDAEPGR